MLGEMLERELKMLEEALRSEEGEVSFRRYLDPMVKEVVRPYFEHAKMNNMPVSEVDIEKAGWTHFSKAIEKYRSRVEKMLNGEEGGYPFSTYFNWYIRQGVVEYLNHLKEGNSHKSN